MSAVSLYKNSEHSKQIHQETGSEFWAVHGEKMSFTFFEVPPHKEFKNHSHIHEQITHVLEGELYFESDGRIHCLYPGDTIIIPSNIEHRVWTNDLPARAVDSWSPAISK